MSESIKDVFHFVTWRIQIFISYKVKAIGCKLLDFGWSLGDHAADKHYFKTKEGISLRNKFLSGEGVMRK